jgi:putative protein-disulfide isomerase
MKFIQTVLIILMMHGNLGCQGQTNKKMEDKNNPLFCDPIEGICGIPNSDNTKKVDVQSVKKPIKVIYFTDPICSSCWAIEPQLRKLKLEYGNNIEFDYRMGGVLPDWNFSTGVISTPSDLPYYWDLLSSQYDMPMDGDVWLEDPLSSSYPPSIAFKAAQIQDNEKALLFLREIREMIYLQKKNIAKWENIEIAANKVGLNTGQLKTDFEGKAKILFEEDLKFTKEYGVRGFPTLFFIDTSGQKETIYGSKSYNFYETALLKLNPNVTKSEYAKSWETLFTSYPSMTAKEFSELSGTEREESEKLLNDLATSGNLEKLTNKNGSIWTRKNINS